MASSPERRIDTELTAIVRHSTSTMGNPTWLLVTEHGEYLTETNGSVGYDAPNFRPRHREPIPVTITVRMLRGNESGDAHPTSLTNQPTNQTSTLLLTTLPRPTVSTHN